MRKSFFIAIVCCLGIGPLAFAQLTVTFPTSRAVFQRNNSNQATLYIGGSFEECLDRIEARVVPRSSGQGTATDWAVLQSNPSGGQFYGSLLVSGGWYTLEVRGIVNNGVVASNAVDRVGVGEVFVVAGQSNATGGDNLPNGPSATDDRVSSVDFQNINPNNGTVTPYPDIKLPCPEFVHLDDYVKTAPFGNYAWCWGIFGDSLARKLNVPVLIFNAGWSGTSMYSWMQSIDINNTAGGTFNTGYPQGLPFGHLRIALNNYIAQQGYRAVLWQQGETDNYSESNRSDYRAGLRAIINASRSLSNKPNLAWVVARVSRMSKQGTSRIWQPVLDAQNDVIGLNGNDPNLYLPHVFPGPETDPLEGPALRTSDNIHFTGNGLVLLAQAWVAKLDPAFFSASQPYLATPPPVVAAQCAGGGNQLAFQGPGGWAAYRWVPEDDCNWLLSSSQNYTASTARYRLKVVDNFQNVLLSPVLNVPASSAATVSTPATLTASQGSNPLVQVSATNGCTFSWTGPNGFSNSAGNFILTNVAPAQAGTYTVSVTNTYGCQAQSSTAIQVVSLVESATSGDWNNAATWSCSCVPTAATDVRIRTGNTVSVSTGVHAKSVLQEGTLQFLNNGNVMLAQ